MSESLNAEAAMEHALAVAERHLDAAIEEAGDIAGEGLPIAMVELCASLLVEQLGHQDTIALLRDLADQIAQDPSWEREGDDE